MLFDQTVGAKLSLIIGRVGEEADEIPMRLIAFDHGQADGNPETAPVGDIAVCIAYQPNRDGELYFRVRKVLAASLFIFDRTEAVEALDGPLPEVVAAASASMKAWAKGRAKAGRPATVATEAAPF